MSSRFDDLAARSRRRWPFWTVVVGAAIVTIWLEVRLIGGIDPDYTVGDFFGASLLVCAVLALIGATIGPLKTACRGLAIGIIVANLALLLLLGIALMLLPGEA